MRIISVVSSSALLALSLGGWSTLAQEALSPSTAAANDNTSASVPPSPAEAPSGNSKVRIVRLSEVKGEVQLDRNTGRGFETPMANLPITEGVKLKTGEGVAEIEFEDNSTVRVGEHSLIEFPRLELLPTGAKASTVNLLQGMVYVSLMNTKGNEFEVNFAKEKLNLPPDSHIRLQMTPAEANLAVLQGDAQVVQPAGLTSLGKNKTMTFNLVGETPPTVAKNVTEEPLDAWDHQSVQYHKNFANASAFGNPTYAYGVNDMNYYGSFINASGCGGSMWRPYFTGAAWDPYSSGAWAYYPSAGYSWVSPYPWGWTPYHTGSWAFCQGVGWGWRPGGAWMGLANNSFAGNPLRPRPPSRAPITAQATIVPVNLKALPASNLADHDKFVFRSNSAGFGVPRGTMGKLNSYSNHVAQHGVATTSVMWSSPQRSTSGEAPRSGNYASPSSGMRSNAQPARSSSSGGTMSSGSMSSGARGGGGGAPSGGGGRH
jgi:FecR protein